MFYVVVVKEIVICDFQCAASRTLFLALMRDAQIDRLHQEVHYILRTRIFCLPKSIDNPFNSEMTKRRINLIGNRETFLL